MWTSHVRMRMDADVSTHFHTLTPPLTSPPPFAALPHPLQMLRLLSTAARCGILRVQSWFDAPFAPKLARLFTVVVSSVGAAAPHHPLVLYVVGCPFPPLAPSALPPVSAGRHARRWTPFACVSRAPARAQGCCASAV